MELKEAYKLVYDDMMANCSPIYRGTYNASNGELAHHYALAISIVMEHIAQQVSEETYENYHSLSMKNMAISQSIAKSKRASERRARKY